MKPKDFDKLLNRRILQIQETLGSKAKEYAFGEDRLHNFKLAARIDNETPAQALWGMFKKHLVSVMDLKDGRLPSTEATLDEKIGDAIIYLILLEAVLKE